MHADRGVKGITHTKQGKKQEKMGEGGGIDRSLHVFVEGGGEMLHFLSHNFFFLCFFSCPLLSVPPLVSLCSKVNLDDLFYTDANAFSNDLPYKNRGHRRKMN